jgi:HNH endonuclease
MKTCTVDGCGKKHLAKGLCSAHYSRVRMHGSTDLPMRKGAHNRSDEERLEFYSTPIPETACVWWIGPVDKQGYGHISSSRRKNDRAHQVAYKLAHGPIPDGMLVMHTCNNPSCVNPEHLELGTNTDNQRYAAECGRKLPGERSPNMKLYDSDVHFIRSHRHIPGTVLADFFGVSTSNIYSIRNNQHRVAKAAGG